MTLIKAMIPLLLVFGSATASANLITNGDFGTCDFTGWEKDTDGFGDVSLGNDFEIRTAGSSCNASINVDYFETQADPLSSPVSEAFFANTLYQVLDFSGMAGSVFDLTISWAFETEADLQDPFFIADYFFIALFDSSNYFGADGTQGYLVGPTDIDDTARNETTFRLDSSFLNTSGWSLDVQLLPGFDFLTGFSDAYGSSLLINNVSLVEVKASNEPPASVNEPSILVLMLLSFLMLVRRRLKI